MKILFDAETPPDVMLFGALADELKNEHDILFLARDFSETIQLLEKKKIKYQVFGFHQAKNIGGKASEFVSRFVDIFNYLRKNKPDICVHRFSVASQASYLLNIPSVSINDNEKAVLASRLALPFTTKAIFPKAIPRKDIIKLFGNLKRTYFYDGIEEMVYLSDFEPNNNVLENLKLNNSRKLIVMRPEQSLALYFHGTEGLLKPVIRELCFENQIVLMARSEKQRQEYLKEFGDNIIIPISAIDGPSLLYYADLFIGAHGTMSREACVLGTPTISMYSGDQLAVEKYLIGNTDRYYHSTDPEEVIKIHADFMKKKGARIKKPELKRKIIEQILSIIE
jgi:predicted glycosyltransferase